MKSSGSFQPAGRDGRASACGLAGAWRAVRAGRLLARAVVARAVRRIDDVDVAAGGGAGEQEALQRGGAQDAAVEVGEDGGEIGGAEAGGDGGEVGGGGAVVDGVEEMAAVAEQDADGVEEQGDVGWGGRGWRRAPCGVSNGMLGGGKEYFPQ